MTDLLALDPALDAAARRCLAVVETSRGARTKLVWDPGARAMRVRRLLPEGMSFPFDFGFVPGTLGGDGDPLDVLVLHEEPLPSGVLLEARLLGVVQAEQTEAGRTRRNDRLLAAAAASRRFAAAEGPDALGPGALGQLEAFFVQYAALRGVEFRIIATEGADAAVRTVAEGRRRSLETGAGARMAVSETPLVERIARVLAAQAASRNARGSDPSAAEAVDRTWRSHMEDARDILRTLREPDARMARRGDPEVWSAMARAALEAEPQPAG